MQRDRMQSHRMQRDRMQITESAPSSEQRSASAARRRLGLAATAALFGSALALGPGHALAAGRGRAAHARGPSALSAMAPSTSTTSTPSGQPEARIVGPMDSVECPNGGASGAISVLGIQALLSPDTTFEGVASCDALAAVTTPTVVELKVQGTLGSFVATEVQVEDANDDGTPDAADSTEQEDGGGSSSQTAAPNAMHR